MYIFTHEALDHIDAKIEELERLEYCGNHFGGYYFDSCLNIAELIADELHECENSIHDYEDGPKGKGYNMVIFDSYKAFRAWLLKGISKNIKERKTSEGRA